MTRPRSRALRRWALAAALVLLPGMAACEPQQLGAAAIIEGQRVTVSDIERTLEDIRHTQEQFGLPDDELPEAARNEIHRRVIVAVYDKAARDLGIVVTQGEIDERAAALRAAAGGEEAYERAQVATTPPRTLAAADDDTRLQLIEAKMAAKLNADAGRTLSQAELIAGIGQRLIATATSMRIRINPRYGSFDPAAGSIEPYPFDYYRTKKA